MFFGSSEARAHCNKVIYESQRPESTICASEPGGVDESEGACEVNREGMDNPLVVNRES